MTEPERKTTPLERLIAKLRHPRAMFNSTQVAFLMGTSARWARESIDDSPTGAAWYAGYHAGYRARVAEENADYPPEPYHLTTSAGEDARVVYRKRMGVDDVKPRPNDFQGLGREAVERLREQESEQW